MNSFLRFVLLLIIFLNGIICFPQSKRDLILEKSFQVNDIDFNFRKQQRFLKRKNDSTFHILIHDRTYAGQINKVIEDKVYTIGKINETLNTNSKYSISYNDVPDSIVDEYPGINGFQITENSLFINAGRYLLEMQLQITGKYVYHDAWQLPIKCGNAIVDKNSGLLKGVEDPDEDKNTVSAFKYSLNNNTLLSSIDLPVKGTFLDTYNDPNYIKNSYAFIVDYLDYKIFIVDMEKMAVVDTVTNSKKINSIKSSEEKINKLKRDLTKNFSKKNIIEGYDLYEKYPAIRKVFLNKDRSLIVLYNTGKNKLRLDKYKYNSCNNSWKYSKSAYGKKIYTKEEVDSVIKYDNFPLRGVFRRHNVLASQNKIYILWKYFDINHLKGKEVNYFKSKKYIKYWRKNICLYGLKVYSF